MGNGIVKLSSCFAGGGEARLQKELAIMLTDPLDEGLGHSFVYVRPDPPHISPSSFHFDESTTFCTISGASVSANTSTPLSTAFVDLHSSDSVKKSATFTSSDSFSAIPLQLIPKKLMNCDTFSGNFERVPGSGPMERGFLSGPIERGLLSGPIEKGCPVRFRRSFSHGDSAFKPKSRKRSMIRVLRKAMAKTVHRRQNSTVTPMKDHKWMVGSVKNNENLTVNSVNFSDCNVEDEEFLGQNLQWAQGKAGEDRVHVVVSEEHGWVFVGIYDGFNGPDAPDFLLSNLHTAVQKELKELLWDDKVESISTLETEDLYPDFPSAQCDAQEDWFDSDSKRRRSKNSRSRYRSAKKWKENQRRWKLEWNRERLEFDKRLKERLNGFGSVNHSVVLKALCQALRRTEEAYLDVADKMLVENPELALMGSCVLVMLIKGEDVYVLNVGDSRAVLARKAEPDYYLGKVRQDLERINEETVHDLDGSDVDQPFAEPLTSLQLTVDHSTSVQEEVWRIKSEHLDDAYAVMNDRVKGSLKVTRAFGAGFLKQPKWNNALLEMFKIDYKGTSPYITCSPSFYHHKLGPKDKFLILSSDGLYQYFTNEEAVSEVELFIQLQPEGDPAQHLVEEVLFRAARRAGMDFHQLLEIPQGDRRQYHDDVSVIIISLEGTMWRSCV